MEELKEEETFLSDYPYEKLFLHCPECPEQALLGTVIKDDKSYIKYKCRNQHMKEIEIEEFLKEQNYSINTITCGYCLEQGINYCYNCKNAICEKKECIEKHNLLNHNKDQIHEILFYDFFCPIHNNKYQCYCETCKIPLCINCPPKHYKHKLNRIIIGFDKERYEKINKTIENICKERNEIINKLELYIKDLKNKLEEFKKKSLLEIQYIKNIVNSYDIKNQNFVFYEVYLNLKNIKIKEKYDFDEENLKNSFPKFLISNNSILETDTTLLENVKEDDNVEINYTSGEIEDTNSNYSGGLLNYQKSGKGVQTFHDGNRYEGEFKNDLMDGVGKYSFNNNDYYEGHFRAGQIDGEGEVKFGNQDVYKGNFRNFKRNGFGIYTFEDKTKIKYTFKGNFKDDNIDGFGSLKSEDGSFSYLGEWNNNVKEGLGLLNQNNYEFLGKFKNNLIEGYGKVTFKNGNKFEGQFLNEKKNGFGIIKLNNGIEYIGQFKEDNKDLFGYQLDKGKIFYEGEFKDDYREGVGRYFLDNGDIYEGEFKKDKRNGTGIMTYKNGDIYEGEWKDGKKEGIGELRFIKGNKYIGEFKNDNIEGEGTYLYSIGKYTGTLINGKREGKGKLESNNGDYYEGEWKNDVFDGNGVYYDNKTKSYFKGLFEKGTKKNVILVNENNKVIENNDK